MNSRRAMPTALLIGQLFAGACQAQTPETMDPAYMRREIAACESRGETVPFCLSWDPISQGILGLLWERAAGRVVDEGADVSIVWTPIIGPTSGPVEGVQIFERAESTSGGSSRTRVVATRKAIARSDVVRLFNEIWSPEELAEYARSVDYDLLKLSARVTALGSAAERLPITLEEADIASCPGAPAKLAELERLMPQQMDVAGIGREPKPPKVLADGSTVVSIPNFWVTSVRLNVRGISWRTRSAVDVTYLVDENHPFGVWYSQLRRVLKPCWRPVPPELS